MAKFDVYRLRTGNQLLLDVQADILSHLRTRLVIVLLPAEGYVEFKTSRLNPVLDIDNRKYVLVTQTLAAIHTDLLGEKVASLDTDYMVITAAIDFLLQGF